MSAADVPPPTRGAQTANATGSPRVLRVNAIANLLRAGQIVGLDPRVMMREALEAIDAPAAALDTGGPGPQSFDEFVVERAPLIHASMSGTPWNELHADDRATWIETTRRWAERLGVRELLAAGGSESALAEAPGPCIHGDELDAYIVEQAQKDPAFATAYLNAQARSSARALAEALRDVLALHVPQRGQIGRQITFVQAVERANDALADYDATLPTNRESDKTETP